MEISRPRGEASAADPPVNEIDPARVLDLTKQLLIHLNKRDRNGVKVRFWVERTPGQETNCQLRCPDQKVRAGDYIIAVVPGTMVKLTNKSAVGTLECLVIDL